MDLIDTKNILNIPISRIQAKSPQLNGSYLKLIFSYLKSLREIKIE